MISMTLHKAKKLLPDAVNVINKKTKLHLKPDIIFSTWIDSIKNLSLSEFEKLTISVKNISPFLAQQVNQYENRRSDATRNNDVPKSLTVTNIEIASILLNDQRSKKKQIPFPELLINLTQDNFDALLVHLKIKDEQGGTILLAGRKSILHELIDALEKNKLVIETTRKKLYNNLCLYLGMEVTRTKNGHLKKDGMIRNKADSYLKRSHLNQK